MQRARFLTLLALHLSCLQNQHRIDKGVKCCYGLGMDNELTPVDYSSCSFNVLTLGKHFPRHFLSPSILSWDSVLKEFLFLYIGPLMEGSSYLQRIFPFVLELRKFLFWQWEPFSTHTLWLQFGNAWALSLVNKFLYLFLPHMLLFSL